MLQTLRLAYAYAKASTLREVIDWQHYVVSRIRGAF